jgi:hypothetical protein
MAIERNDVAIEVEDGRLNDVAKVGITALGFVARIRGNRGTRRTLLGSRFVSRPARNLLVKTVRCW